MAKNFSNTTLYDYQTKCLRTWKQFDPTTFSPLEMELLHSTLLIADEAGELVSAFKKWLIYRKPLDVDNVREELGDLLYGLVVLADKMGFSMEEIMDSNVKKLEQRYPKGYSDEDAILRRDKQE